MEKWVTIAHPDIPGSRVTTTEEAFKKLRAPQGWELVDEEAEAAAAQVPAEPRIFSGYNGPDAEPEPEPFFDSEDDEDEDE